MFSTSIGKKLGMAFTGLILYSFLIGHLVGNFQLFASDGGAAFNAYAAFLTGNPLIIPTEMILLAVLLVHVYLATSLSLASRRARPQAYASLQSVGGRSLASRTMIWTGSIILIFLVIHIRTFKFGDLGEGTLFDLVAGKFREPLWASAYVLMMGILGFHLWHAMHSAFQTLGWYARAGWRRASIAMSLFIAGGFAAIPIYFYLAQ
ncbi:MAG: succinate dehydrogenase cytochrome b subunit [Gemmatimonadetes bacterium]|nr:succinate dehydrogenase cytochrome b subunit [Gemmatimonadota bacterium]MBT6146743.1 succinate dehydrogenase cytochrome b subunit [Gemmatimonadota bacterium]MBT7864543.1 succinate dehydrogenase cytochrome b subunit [Gemmatimonadota bacterium]